MCKCAGTSWPRSLPGLDCRGARPPGKRPCYGAFDFIAFGVDKQPFADSEHLQEWLEEGQMKNTAVLVLSLSLAGGGVSS